MTSRQRDPLGPFCRGCRVPLRQDNARCVRSGQNKPRFTGMCRARESAAARERYERRHPDAGHYTDARRIYPLRQTERSA